MLLAIVSTVFVLQTVLYGVFVSRSPWIMDSTLPKTIWADEPMELITTPQFETGKNDLFTVGATHMALLHNAIIRGFNSIYVQAPHVEKEEVSNFVGYAQTWYRFVKSHHDDEEENLFTKVEEVLDDKTVFAETHGEHESFMSGLLEFDTYLSTLPHASAFSPTELLRIMDSFRLPFEQHFHHEITTIASLSTHPSVPTAGSPEETAAAAIFKAWGKKTVTKAGMTDVVPFFLMNLDRMAENGMWASWPPMPAPVKWGLKNIVGMWYAGYWKFASCDAFGAPRELYALEEKTKKDGKKYSKSEL